MSEENLTNDEKIQNKAFKPKTKLNKAINIINIVFLIIVLILSIVGLKSVLTSTYEICKYGYLGIIIIYGIIFFGFAIFIIFNKYYKYFLKIIGHCETYHILLHIIVLVNIVISLIIIIGTVFGYSTLMDMHKPAIYLYPEKMTEVSITLDPSIKLDIDIPRYVNNKGWKVMAHPDGKLVDLQPEYTNCTKLETKISGLEYAREACELNNYPYIFWEGKQTSKTLQAKKEGWLVRKEDTKTFLEDKLNFVGFNDAEKKEFLAYWEPRILELKQEKVFIYFAQNEEINEYLPMKITPQPDSVNRFYIIVDTHIKDHENPDTQELIPFNRHGFAVVDWGGCLIK